MNEAAGVSEGSRMPGSVLPGAILLYRCSAEGNQWIQPHRERRQRQWGWSQRGRKKGLGLSGQQVRCENNLFFSRVKQKQILWVIMNLVLLMRASECEETEWVGCHRGNRAASASAVWWSYGNTQSGFRADSSVHLSLLHPEQHRRPGLWAWLGVGGQGWLATEESSLNQHHFISRGEVKREQREKMGKVK